MVPAASALDPKGWLELRSCHSGSAGGREPIELLGASNTPANDGAATPGNRLYGLLIPRDSCSYFSRRQQHVACLLKRGYGGEMQPRGRQRMKGDASQCTPGSQPQPTGQPLAEWDAASPATLFLSCVSHGSRGLPPAPAVGRLTSRPPPPVRPRAYLLWRLRRFGESIGRVHDLDALVRGWRGGSDSDTQG